MRVPAPRRTANRHPEITAQLRAILSVTAARDEQGGLMLCRPRDMELRFHPANGHPNWSANNGKVCFATKSNADRAADGIACIAGADPVVTYRCPRDGSHFHHVSAARRSDTSWAILTRIAVAARRARGEA